MRRPQLTNTDSRLSHETAVGTRVALWWLRHYDTIIRFWTGFSWIWVIGLLLSIIVGYLDLARGLSTILLIGLVTNTGAYLAVRSLASHLKGLQDGPDRDEAHELMIQIMRRRTLIAR